MKKFILCACLAIATLASCSHEDEYENLQYSQYERALLLEFLDYCRNTAMDTYPHAVSQYNDKSLRDAAIFYMDQYIFADVTDFYKQAEIDDIVYRR